jgi:hypothetical protein
MKQTGGLSVEQKVDNVLEKNRPINGGLYVAGYDLEKPTEQLASRQRP